MFTRPFLCEDDLSWFFTPHSPFVLYMNRVTSSEHSDLPCDWGHTRILALLPFFLFPVQFTSTQNKPLLPPLLQYQCGNLNPHWYCSCHHWQHFPKEMRTVFAKISLLYCSVSQYRSNFALPGNTGQFLKTFLVITNRRVFFTNIHRCYWHQVSKPVMLLNSLQWTGQLPRTPTFMWLKKSSSAEAEKLCSKMKDSVIPTNTVALSFGFPEIVWLCKFPHSFFFFSYTETISNKISQSWVAEYLYHQVSGYIGSFLLAQTIAPK